MKIILALITIDLKNLINKKTVLMLILSVLIYISCILALSKGNKESILYFLKGPNNQGFDFLLISLWLFPYIIYFVLIGKNLYGLSRTNLYLVFFRLKSIKQWIFAKAIALAIFNSIFQTIFFFFILLLSQFFYIEKKIILDIYILSFFNFTILTLLFLFLYCINLKQSTNLSLIMSLLIFNSYTYVALEPFSKYMIGNQGFISRSAHYYTGGLSIYENVLMSIFFIVVIVLSLTIKTFKLEGY